jgi:probable HAF family extracellular repeat protein
MGARRILLVAAAAALSACVPVAELQPHDLGTFGGLQSEATDVNDAGLVVGWAEGLDGRAHAFRVRPGEILERLDGDGSERSTANAVNGTGHVAGTRGDKAVVWAPDGTMRELPSPDVEGGAGVNVAFIANDINDGGVVVGTISFLYGEATQGFAYRPDTGVLQPLGTFATGFGDARAVNAHGQIVGWQFIAGRPTGVVWDPDPAGGWRPARALPELGTARWGQAEDIADDGTIVGSGFDRAAGVTRAFVWPGGGGAPIEIPTPPGNASADGIDSRGVVVGSLNASGDIWNPRRIAYRWTVGGPEPEGLRGIGGPVSEANASNARGEVVGRGNPPQPAILHAIRWSGGTG